MQPTEETTFSFSNEAPPQDDRRRQPRHLTILRVGTLIVKERRELCLVRNISAGGLKAHIYSSLAEGDPVEVELNFNERIPGTVAWADGSSAGVEFDECVDVEELLSSHTRLENGWRPRLPRVEVDCLATLRLGSTICGASARDISQGGVKIETDCAFKKGDEVVLTLDQFRPLAGVVCWYEDGLSGIAFNQVIPFQELIGWLRKR